MATCCSSSSNSSMASSAGATYQPRCPNRVGSITVILGPMFSGKTTELLRLHDRQIIAKRTCVLVKYAGDTRYDAELVATHSKMMGQGRTVKAHRLSEVRSQIFANDVQVVSIDEGQFFDDLADTCEELANCGKVVCVAALNGTFERKPFTQVSLLLPYANEIKQVSAVCVECGAQANFSFRSTMDKKVEVIGGTDTYEALCRECYVVKSELRDAEEKMHELGEKDENDEIGGIVLAPRTNDSASVSPADRCDQSPPRKKIGLSKSVQLENASSI